MSIAFLFFLAAIVFQIWMLVDAVQRPEDAFTPPKSKTWWIVGLVVGIFLPLLGIAAAVAYFLVVRKPALEGRSGGITFRPSAGPPRGMKVCRTCGEEIGTHAMYCQRCGTPVREDP